MQLPLHTIQLTEFLTESGFYYPEFELSYQQFGQPLGSAPVILINHALTGNSNVAGPDGWWRHVVGPGLAVDTSKFTVLAFNAPGNSYDGKSENLIKNVEDWTARDAARLFLSGLEALGVERLHALIGGSLGGGIAWEMVFLAPDLPRLFVPVASDWKASDWIIAHNTAQQHILSHSSKPVHDARMMAMLFYRTAESFKRKFNRARDESKGQFVTESWLQYHGQALENRFSVTAYKMMNRLLSTVDVTRDRGVFAEIAPRLRCRILQVAIDSDFFFVPQEIKETREILDKAGVANDYAEIQSVHGHDAFLIEHDQVNAILRPFLCEDKPTRQAQRGKKPLIMKFGGRSLANGEGLRCVVSVVQNKLTEDHPLVVVASARGQTTDLLVQLLELASVGKDYQHVFSRLRAEQQVDGLAVDLEPELSLAARLLDGVALLGECSPRVSDRLLSLGELMSVKTVAAALRAAGVDAEPVDARQFLQTDDQFGQAHPLHEPSCKLCREFFARFRHSVPVVTGFIGSTVDGQTTTLGRNGSNYSAALLANYLDACELQNYTHVDGIFTANPDLVPEARRIDRLSYREASELASLGASVLHAKTIGPLAEKNIPLRLCNTFNPADAGTLISARGHGEGVRAVTAQSDQALITLFGRGLLGKAGIDARIFQSLGAAGISVSVISQGSSEKGIGLVVRAEQAQKARKALEKTFAPEMAAGDVDYVRVTEELGVLSIIGQQLSGFHKPYEALIRNGVSPVLINSSVTGDNISLVMAQDSLPKALNVIHGKIAGIPTTINLALFGKGQVGSALIEQILQHSETLRKRRGIRLRIFALADSRRVLLRRDGIGSDWRSAFAQDAVPYEDINAITTFAREHHLENLIAVDNTASAEFVRNYLVLVENGFDLVSSNKIANTLDMNFYRQLRTVLASHQKKYLYETNVGAGLPLVDTIALLHQAGENITAIKGVFSGTLSYLFNRFSVENKPFSVIVRDAMRQGLTEPDPREDLSGMDVARKLLILARELDLHNELKDVRVENLVPAALRDIDKADFLTRLDELNPIFERIKAAQPPGHVLRYVGELGGDLQQSSGQLRVQLVSVPAHSALGQVSGADSIFEIHTESYGQRPIVIQGAGAGAKVTARGVFGDILRLTQKAI